MHKDYFLCKEKKMIYDLVDACTCLYTSENNGCECSKYAACLNQVILNKNAKCDKMIIYFNLKNPSVFELSCSLRK